MYRKYFFGILILHLISATHSAHGRSEVAPGNILMGFTWFEYRLLANNPFTIYLTVDAIGINNFPVSAKELYRSRAKVLDGNPVSKNVFVCEGV